MGGYGSTRWYNHHKKTTVEECNVLSISALYRDGLIRSGFSSGHISWRNWQNEIISSVSFTLREISQHYLLTLSYHFTSGRHEGEKVELPIWLHTTEPHFGGVRYWFTCPLVIHDQACRRRVAKLYRPPGSLYYGCRHCYDLSYQSAQEAHKLDRSGSELIRKMAELDRLINRYHKAEQQAEQRQRRRQKRTG